MTDRAALAEDRDARRLAQTEFVRPLVLEAGAGTGKTTTLVARIVVWCLGPGWSRAEEALRRAALAGAAAPGPDEIAARVVRGLVAITFTEAAAAEMATRIGRTLTGLAGGAGAPEWIAAELLPEAGERAVRARALVGVLDRLVVRTIHAFCRRLLASHPIEAGLHPQFEVDADGSLVSEIAREEIERALVQAYGEPGDAAFLALASAGLGPSDLGDALERLALACVPASALEHEGFTPERCAALRDELGVRLEAFLSAGSAELASLRGAPAVVETVERAQRALSRVESLRAAGDFSIDALVEVVTSELAPRAAYLVKFAAAELGKKGEAILGDRLAAVAAAAADLSELVTHLTQLDVPVFEAGRAALAPILARVEERMRRKGVVTFDALLRRAHQLVETHPEIAALERARIDQLLVDEFQDTDPVQCAIVRALALDGPADARPGLFLVGDPKQSIFGWRSADLGAYDAFLDLVGRDHVRRLCVNFRSAPVILEEVTRLVEPVMREQRGVQPAFQRLEPSEKTAGQGGCRDDRFAPVEHWVSCDLGDDGGLAPKTRTARAAELEAHALALDLLELRRRHDVAWGRVALLFRSLTQVDPYLEALREAGIPFEVAKDRSYYRRREVIEAAALVRCVIDPHDVLALVTWLRSVAVGVPDAALVPLWARGFPERVAALRRPQPEQEAELVALVRAAAAAIPAGVPGLERVAGWERALVAACASLARLRASFEQEPCDVFVERLRVETRVEALEAARHLGAYRVANLDRFFRELAESLASEGDAAALLRRLREDVSEGREALEGRLREAAADAVQVLSIHAAKGLDFEHVYCLQLHKGHKGARGGGGTDAPRAEVARLGGEIALRLFGAPGPRDHLWKRAASQREEAEARRLLYVATTRAKQRLVLAGLRRVGDAKVEASSLAALLEQRAGGAVDVDAMARDLAEKEDSRHRDSAEARWCFVAFEGEPIRPLDRATAPLAPDAALAESDARRLRAASEAAEARERRAMLQPASAGGHEAARERREQDEPRSDGTTASPASPRLGLETSREVAHERGRAVDREIAQSIGTAIHRVLEAFDPRADPASEEHRLSALLRRALAALVPSDRRERVEAEAEATAILGGFWRGPLAARLRALAAEPGTVLLRELPLLGVPPGVADAPAGALTGAIDLLYRSGGEWIVADFKTDDVGREALRERAASYAAQGEAYRRAVQEALGLSALPRFELWFLRAGEVVPVEVPPGV